MKKISFIILSLIILLSVSMKPHITAAEPMKSNVEKEAFLTEQEEKGIDVYDNMKADTTIDTLSDETKVIVLEEDELYSFIQYEVDGNTEEGYVENEVIVFEEDEEDADNEEGKVTENSDDEQKGEVTTGDIDESEEDNSSVNGADEKQENESSEDQSSNEGSSEQKVEVAKVEKLQGYAQRKTTYVYADTSKESSTLKNYHAGKILKYEAYDNNWYKAKVKVKGKYRTGYIHKDDVGSKKPSFKEYAQKKTTNVYSDTSKKSSVLKGYHIGDLLKFKAHNGSWYEAKVKVGGKYRTGYIHKDDVGPKKPKLEGYAQQKTTNVYAGTSKESTVLKSYYAGKLLKFEAYNNSWYEAKVKVGGKYRTGYIHKDDVGSKKPKLEGYAQQKTTNVYASTSKKSTILKDYYAGTLLKFKAHNGTWYEAKVKVGGKYRTGYIHKDDVGSKKPKYEGYAQEDKTSVHMKASEASKVLKSYEAGTLLKYRPYNDQWYEATVYLKGKKHIGYIHKKQLGNKKPTLSGFAAKKSTAVYSSDSRNAKVLKTYKKGKLLKYKPYNKSWYKATVYINGTKKTGYIHKNDVLSSVGKTVVIDAGHGGSDPGTSANGIKEKDLALNLAKQTERELERSGFNVIMTRTTDEYIALKQRTDIANNSNSHLFLSIHVNSGGGKGIETWWQKSGPKPKESEQFAQDIQSEVIKETKATDRGTKEGNLHVNRESNMPSGLLEVGFVDNKEEAEELKKDSYQKSIVKGIVNGIKKFFKIS